MNAGRDIVAPADGGVDETGTAGRDMVDDAGDPAPDVAAAAAGCIPVAEADEGPGAAAAVAGRMPVAEVDAVETGFGAPGLALVGAAAGEDEGALAAAAGTRVVPHCTQNFAPG